MNVINYRVSLDMLDVISQATIKAKKGDSACKIYITLAKNGKLYKISEGCSATFTAKKSDGNFVYDKCTIEGDTIVYDFSTSVDDSGVCQITACEGIVDCEVTLFKGFDQLTSPRFSLVVDSVVYNGEEIVSTSESDVLKELINEANSVIDEVETKLANGEFVGEKGEQGEKGEKGDQGERGERGEKGDAGYTPIKGVDYWTESDQAEIMANTASSIVCEASGEAIIIGDASNRTLQGLNVYGKTEQFTTQGRNKLDLLSIIGEDYTNTVNGVTVKIENGYAVFSGAYTASEWKNVLSVVDLPLNQFVLPAGTYTSNISLQLRPLGSYDGANYSKTFTISEPMWVYGVYYAFGTPQTVSVSVPLVVMEGTQAPTEYEPYTGGMPSPNPDYPQSMDSVGEDGEICCRVCGKNLIPFPYIHTDRTDKGVSFTVQDDGGIKVVGTATGDVYFNLCRIHFSDGPLRSHLASLKTDGNVVISGGDSSTRVCYDHANSRTYLFIPTGNTVDTVVYPQIEYGTTPTEYEPYTEQSLALPILNEVGLAGVPVASGGNYTDVNGQQWVCDEVDFSRGVYVQRIMKYTLTGTERWGISSVSVTNAARFDCTVSGYPAAVIEDVLSSHCVYSGTNKIDTSIGMNMWARTALDDLYRLNLRIVLPTGSTVETLTTFLQEEMTKGTPVEILYALNTPIETPLDAETLSAFATLHTNKPNTTITNDSGAWMSAEYVADTKLYIDNKFAELAKAIVSNS